MWLGTHNAPQLTPGSIRNVSEERNGDAQDYPDYYRHSHALGVAANVALQLWVELLPQWWIGSGPTHPGYSHFG